MGDTDKYARELLTAAVGDSHTWNELMRRLGLKPSGGQRRVLQQKGAAHGIDTSHFKQSGWGSRSLSRSTTSTATGWTTAPRTCATSARTATR